MCDQDEKSAKNSKGDEDMGITKPIRPIKIEFNTKQEIDNFDKWAKGKSPASNTTKRLRSDLIKYREMKRLRKRDT